jgi:DNA-binding NtrC family response regulator
VLDIAVALTEGDVIEVDTIVIDDAPPREDASRLGAASYSHGGSVGDDLSLRNAEQAHIRRVLAIANGSKRQAARLLRLSRSTLDRKLAQMAREPAARKP